MPTAFTVQELRTAAGRELGPGPWQEVTQEQVDAFAAATGDDQWIHVDPERAADGPFGTTIAHGYLSLSLLPVLQRDLWSFSDARMVVNYGLDKLRFPSPVPVGSRLRLRLAIDAVDERPDGSLLLHSTATVEREGSDRPAVVASTLALVVG